MSDQAEKKTICGWRVKVRNVIKVVSTNRKPPRIKSEAISVRSPKFFVHNTTPMGAVKQQTECGGDVMMLEAAEVQFGISPVRKTFRGQKLLIYTLPNERNLDGCFQKVPVENIRKSIENIGCNLDNRAFKRRILETVKLKNNFEEDAVEKRKVIEISGLPDGKTMEPPPSIDILSETGEEGLKTQSEKEPSLFCQPIPNAESPVQGMYFGPQPMDLKLDVN